MPTLLFSWFFERIIIFPEFWKRHFTKYYFPLKADIGKSASHLYAKKILLAKSNTWDDITDQIYGFSKSKNIDPYIILAIYYIESYYRPKWFVLLEYILFKLGILSNPSIGPFQIRATNLKDRDWKALVKNSLDYIYKLVLQNELNYNNSIHNFAKMGKAYNLDTTYGKVIFRLCESLKKQTWTLSRRQTQIY